MIVIHERCDLFNHGIPLQGAVIAYGGPNSIL